MMHSLYFDLRGVLLPAAPKNTGQFEGTLRLDARLTPGCYAVLVQTPAQGDAFILSCSGLLRARQGQLQLDGENPHRSPTTRSRIVSLLAQEMSLEEEPRAQTVEQFVRRLPHLARGKASSLPEALHPLRLRPVAQLNHEERRRLMLELALGHAAPQLALLYEPWSTLEGEPTPEQRLLNEVQRLVHQGCVVVLVTVSRAQAERYSAQLLQPLFEPKRPFFQSWRSA